MILFERLVEFLKFHISSDVEICEDQRGEIVALLFGILTHFVQRLSTESQKRSELANRTDVTVYDICFAANDYLMDIKSFYDYLIIRNGKLAMQKYLLKELTDQKKIYPISKPINNFLQRAGFC